MEKIETTEEQNVTLITGFKKMKSVGLAFFLIGILGMIPIVPLFAGIFSSASITYTTPTFGFLAVGIIFMAQADSAVKRIKNNEYQVYKTKCIRKRFLNEYAEVENNEILSKKMRRPVKSIVIIGSHKSINPDDEIGIIQIDKKYFYAFSL